MNHSLLAPSSAATWLACHGSVIMRASAGLPSETSDAAEEGTAAHFVASTILETIKDGRTTAQTPAQWAEWLGVDPDGTTITEDMVKGALLYVDYIIDNDLLNDESLIEAKLEIPSIHPDCYGFVDFVGFKGGEIHVVDFKYGFANVDAFKNKQLIAYYAGVADLIGLNGLEDQSTKVVFHIVQPRCFHGDGPIKKWATRASDLRGEVNKLSAAAHEAMGSSPTTASGTQCRYCPARHCCESSRRAAVAGIAYRDVATPHPLTDQALAFELPDLRNAVADLKYRLEALEEEAVARIKAGKTITGVTAVPRLGQRKFTVDSESVFSLGEIAGVSLKTDPSPVTPAEAERRLMKAGMSKKEASEYLSSIVKTPSIGMKIQIDDGAIAEKVFSKETV